METYTLPTGVLFVDDYSKGKLETLSIGDYGKRHNVKAQFLGLNDDIRGVPDGARWNLSEKWVITLSTQYGCPMKCTFCDVPKVDFGGNATTHDLKAQFLAAIKHYSDISYTERLNVHFARMGEPLLNFSAVEDFAIWLGSPRASELLRRDFGLRFETVHPVLTSCVPKISKAEDHLSTWCSVKNYYFRGQAGLQLSINSTDEAQRREMFGSSVMELKELATICSRLPTPVGRKYCLNFALADDYAVSPSLLSSLFDKDAWMVKITPIHNSAACVDRGIKTTGGYDSYQPYRKAEEELVANGWDVLVFVPSMEEERGLITCGNAVLSGSVPIEAGK